MSCMYFIKYLVTKLVVIVTCYQCSFVVVIKLNITTWLICPFVCYVPFECDY